MARIQALTQLQHLERGFAPAGSRAFTGMSGMSEGVPKMHPLKSSFPVFRASSLLHGLRIKTPRMRIPGLRLPKV